VASDQEDMEGADGLTGHRVRVVVAEGHCKLRGDAIDLLSGYLDVEVAVREGVLGG